MTDQTTPPARTRAQTAAPSATPAATPSAIAAPATDGAAMLPRETLLAVVRHTPLVSVDLICRDPQGRVLLGWRANQPARGCWFVPGGRIRKDERVAQALQRVITHELGLPLDALPAAPQLSSLGAWEHLYPNDNFAAEPGVSTHYVVLAWQLQLDAAQAARLSPDAQHRELRWFAQAELLADPQVHANTRAYFDPSQAPTRLPG